MSTYLRMRLLAATAIASVSLIATVCGAQPITVNGVSCTAANAVTVTYSSGALNIVTGGCGTTTVPPITTAPPSIDSVWPPSGTQGDGVVIYGANLGGATVTIAGKTATIGSNSGTQIVTSVPTDAVAGASGGITVTTAASQPANSPFTVTTVQPASSPGILSITPGSGAPGDTVVILGLNLTGATVTIGGLNAPVVTNSRSRIAVTVPIAAPANNNAGFVVTTSVGPPGTGPFRVTGAPPSPAPVITTVSAASGPVGLALTITGTGFTGASVTIAGVPANITAISSTSISTTVPTGAPVGAGKVIVTTASGNNSRDFTVTAIPQGADISVDGMTLPNPSKLGNVFGAPHQGLNGAGVEVNAYAMDPTRCVATPALTRSWQHNINLDDYQNKHALDYIAMKSGEALSFKFTVGQIDIGGGFQFADAAAAGANIRPGFMSVSATPCDFDTTKVLTNTSGNGCYLTGINGVTVNWANITGTLPVSYCKLEKGKTYYLNLRFQDARSASAGGQPNTDSCANGDTCGGILQFF